MSKRMHFRVSHRDKAERAIITALRSVGASVYQVNGKDLPDLVVGFRGVTTLLEVKTKGLETTDKRNGKTYTRTTETSKGQKKFLETWRGGPAAVVHEPVEALMMIGCPFVAEMEGPRWLALNGAFLCEGCWVPENGLHDTKCPRRQALKVPGKVKSAYRAAKEARDVLLKKRACVVCPAPTNDAGYACAEHDPAGISPASLASIAGELKPVPGLPMAPSWMAEAVREHNEELAKAKTCEMGPCLSERMGHSPYCIVHSNPIVLSQEGQAQPVTMERVKAVLEKMRPSRGVEGELQPLKKRTGKHKAMLEIAQKAAARGEKVVLATPDGFVSVSPRPSAP